MAFNKVKIDLPDGLVINEAWGSMTESRYVWIQSNPPPFSAWLRYYLAFGPHPYTHHGL